MDKRRTPEQTDLTKLEGDPTPHADEGFVLGNSAFGLEAVHDSDGTTRRKLWVTGPAGSSTGTAIAMGAVILMSSLAGVISLAVVSSIGAPWWLVATVFAAVLAAGTIGGYRLIKHHPQQAPPPPAVPATKSPAKTIKAATKKPTRTTKPRKAHRRRRR